MTNINQIHDQINRLKRNRDRITGFEGDEQLLDEIIAELHKAASPEVARTDDNEVGLVFSHTDSDGDWIDVYRVVWPDDVLTYTVDSRSPDYGCVLVSLDQAAAKQLAAILDA